jgi:hypothetical protein
MQLELTDDQLEVGSCVYKLFYGDKYVIVKAKTLSGSIYLFQKGLMGFLNASGIMGKEGYTENTFFFRLYKGIKKTPKQPFRIEILLESNDPYSLLVAEQAYLNESIKDKKCLNVNVLSYVPKYRKATNSYGWIPVEAVERYLATLRSLNEPVSIP